MLNNKSDQIGLILLVFIIIAVINFEYALLIGLLFGGIIAFVVGINLICDILDWLKKRRK